MAWAFQQWRGRWLTTSIQKVLPENLSSPAAPHDAVIDWGSIGHAGEPTPADKPFEFFDDVFVNVSSPASKASSVFSFPALLANNDPVFQFVDWSDFASSEKAGIPQSVIEAKITAILPAWDAQGEMGLDYSGIILTEYPMSNLTDGSPAGFAIQGAFQEMLFVTVAQFGAPALAQSYVATPAAAIIVEAAADAAAFAPNAGVDTSTVDAGDFAMASSRPYAAGEAIVKLLPGIDPAIYADLLSRSGVESVERLDTSGFQLWHLSGSFEAAYNTIGNSSYFEFFQPNYEIYDSDFAQPIVAPDQNAALTPNDPGYGSLYGLNKISAPSAWNLTTGGTVKVAVIDTGVDWNHQDLAANIWSNPGEIAGNGIDDDNNGYIDDIRGWDFYNRDNNPMDDNGHGTHVSGTIAAVGNNGIGVTGVAWSADIIPLKFLSASGSGSTADAIKAVNYAAMMGAKVINASWGGSGFSATLQNAINNSGLLFVAAAGNDAFNTDIWPHYPSAYNSNNVISVASTTSSDTLSSFSNYGLVSVDLGAPGSSIYSTLPGNSYGTYSGTSMAAPHVAGVAALLWSLDPTLTVSEVKNAILSQADPLASLSGKVATGGRLDAYGAIASVLNTAPIAAISDHSLKVEQWSLITNWLAYSDADGNPATHYQLWDGGSAASSAYFWTPNNPHNPAGVDITVTAAAFTDTWIRGGQTGGSETMWVRAFDGLSWSAWDSFTLTTLPNTLPVATINDHTVKAEQWARVSDWLTYSDADGNAATQYQLWDGGTAASSGYFWTPSNPHHAAGVDITVTSANLGDTWIRGGQTTGSETMWVRAFDGHDWSNWDSFTFTTVPNTPPVATINDHTVNANQWSRVSDWLTYSDAEGDPATHYQLWDDGTAASSGYFSTPDNHHNPSGVPITVTAAAFADTWVSGGQTGGSEAMWIRALDGVRWGEWDQFTLTTIV